jgi:hypothetical protein
MRVLDLDLDFFLSDCCPLAPLGQRPDRACAQPWTEAAVREFLETRCGLRTGRKTPGRIFSTHDQAIDFWQEQMCAGRLTAPFSLVHVDAHADLGIGAPGPDFVLRAVLTQACKRRVEWEKYRAGKKMDEANYLLFALAFRWIDDLTLVRNPQSRPDIPPVLWAGEEAIRLGSPIARLMEAANGREPLIPFHVYDDYRQFAQDGFDFVTLAHSPRYTPKTADALLETIRSYVVEC